jgi:hypothetical protein
LFAQRLYLGFCRWKGVFTKTAVYKSMLGDNFLARGGDLLCFRPSAREKELPLEEPQLHPGLGRPQEVSGPGKAPPGSAGGPHIRGGPVGAFKLFLGQVVVQVAKPVPSQAVLGMGKTRWASAQGVRAR